MAKASAIEMRHADEVKGIHERLERIENILTSGAAALEVEREDGWIVPNEEMQGLIGTVEQLCDKAGLAWESLDFTSEGADPIAHIQTRLGMVADRLFAPINQALVGVNTDKPAASGKNK